MLILSLTKLTLIAGVLLMCYNLYFILIALFGAAKKEREKPLPEAKPQTRFLCVAAARNEEAVIGYLTDSLLAQAYPKELFTVLIAPNNCTDNTAAVAKEHGATLFIPTGEIHSKGEVLTQIADEMLSGDDYDAMCVFDADNLVDTEFLSRMNDAIVSGAEVVQGLRDSKNPSQSAVSGWYSIGYWLLHRFYNCSRSALGLSALVNGSGFVVTRSLLERTEGWHTTTMTEDYEFSAQCVCAGANVKYVPQAIIYDEQPITFSQSWNQRRRWTTGSLQSFFKYHQKLITRAIMHRSRSALDMYITFLTPITQVAGVVLCAISCGLLLAGNGIVIGKLAIYGFWRTAAMLSGGTIFAVILSMCIAAFIVVLQKNKVKQMAKSIASFWVFLGSYLLLTILSFFSRKTTWDPIAHTSAKSLTQFKAE